MLVPFLGCFVVLDGFKDVFHADFVHRAFLLSLCVWALCLGVVWEGHDLAAYQKDVFWEEILFPVVLCFFPGQAADFAFSFGVILGDEEGAADEFDDAAIFVGDGTIHLHSIDFVLIVADQEDILGQVIEFDESTNSFLHFLQIVADVCDVSLLARLTHHDLDGFTFHDCPFCPLGGSLRLWQ